jgi:putative transcriptional regulator
MEPTMKRLLPNLKSFATLLLTASALSGAAAAAAADVSEPMVLVSSPGLNGSALQQAVVLATPLPDGGHIGFIINRPIDVKLQTLFPDDAAASNVKESVYLGGPALLPAIFALASTPPENPGTAIPLMPGLFAVMDSDAIDRIIEQAPNDAGYFLGMMVWNPDELEEEVRKNVWELRPADADLVLRAKSRGLWRSLRGAAAYI